LKLDRQARLAHLVEEPVEVLEARLRRERPRLGLVGAEDAEHAAHLRQCRAAGVLDRQERLALAVLIRVE
jgi:hypothetical protein